MAIRDDLLAKRVPQCPKCEVRHEEKRRLLKRRRIDASDDEDDGLAYGIMKVCCVYA